MRILVTGCAGFIGSSLTDRILADGHEVIGVDNFNDYYDPRIKEDNLKIAKTNKNFKLFREDILNYQQIKKIFKVERPNKVVHLAARAGVRPSIRDPKLYANVNVLGTVNLLKLSVDFDVKQFIFGSSSSVYGNSNKLPFLEADPCEEIISPYGASKRAAEFWVESFHRSYGIKSIILRFFTVYGLRGRPDMAPAIFTKAILNGKTLNKFGNGDTERDYTYIDDIIYGITNALEFNYEFEVINLGNNKPVSLNDFIGKIELLTNKKARTKTSIVPKGDVQKTWAGISKAKRLLNWQPKTDLEVGLKQYIRWLNLQI